MGKTGSGGYVIESTSFLPQRSGSSWIVQDEGEAMTQD